MKKINRLVQLLLLILLLSCKKDKDEVFPEILVSSPSQNSQYNVLDDVAIRASITDNEIIKQVTVSLYESPSNRQVLSTLSFSPNTNVFELAATYPIADSLLPSGTYYFKIEAKDQENTSTSFLHVNITGIPKKKIGVFVTCVDNGSTRLYTDKNDFNFELYTLFSEPYFASVLNSYDQQFWFIPKGKGNIIAYQLNEKQIEFEESVNSTFDQAYTAIKLYNRDVFISTKDGDVLGFNSNYSRNYYYQSLTSRSIVGMGISDEYLLVDEVNLTGSDRFINVLYRSTGIVKSGIAINYPTVEISFFEEEKALLFQNDENGGRISEINIEVSALRSLSNFADSILSVEKINDNEYLLSTSTKVLQYNRKNGNVLDILQVPNATLCYDALSNQLFVASGAQLELYNYPLTSMVQATTLPFSIEGIEIRYNK